MSANTSPTPQRTLTIDISASPDGTPILVCRGRITLEGSGQFKAQVKSLSPQNKFLLADMSGVDFVDSSGLGGILGTYLSAKSDGCDLKLIHVNPRIKDLLDLTSLSKVLEGSS